MAESLHMPTANSAYKATLEPAAFRKNPDGSWTSIRNSDVPTITPEGTARVCPGMTFHKGRTYWGIDVVGQLEQSANK